MPKKKTKRKKVVTAKSSEFYFTDRVTSHSITTLLEKMQPYRNKKVTLYVQSDGGDVDAGVLAYSVLKTFKKLRTIASSVYSSATFLLLASEDRVGFSNSTYLVHKPSMRIDDVTSPDNLEDIRYNYANVERLIEDIYKEAGMIDVSYSEKYFNSAEALRIGLIKGVI